MATVVQTGTLGATATTSASSSLSATTAGNTIIVAAWFFGSTTAPTFAPGNCTDNKAGGSSSYSLAANTADLVIATHHFNCAVWFVTNCAAGITSVTVTNANVNFVCTVAYEITPLTTVDTSLDGSSPTANTTPAVGPMTAGGLSAIEVAVLCTDNHGGTLVITSTGTSFVMGQSEGNNNSFQAGAVATRVANTQSASITESWNVANASPADGNSMLLVSFNAAPPAIGQRLGGIRFG